MRKIYSFFSYLIFTLLLLVIFVLAGARYGLPGQTHVLTVQSGSMEPVIKTGGAIAVSPSGEYNAGDIITFIHPQEPGLIVTHRISRVAMENGQNVYYTKGDGNDVEDKLPVIKENIIGEVKLSVRYLGYVINFLKTPIGFLAAVMIPAIIIIYGEIFKIGRQVQAIRQRKQNET